MQIKGFDSNFIEELKNKVDIVDVVSSYVPSLERKGSNYWGACPFHHEKTPSFSVNREQGFYKCFGCGVGGDVLTFVMAVEGIPFMDAVHILADKAGMEVPKLSLKNGGEDLKQKRDRLAALMKDAARIYHANLSLAEAAEANAYIQKREIKPESVVKFGLGYSNGYTDIITKLSSKGYTREEMLSAGVIEERNGRFFDAMANRLIFPIVDGFGNVIAFGGRVLGKTDFAKYKNTGDTLLFTKKKNLYGINYIKKLRLKQRVTDLIMVEGYMDTLALMQAGVSNVVASMGTSLTEAQASLAKRYVDEIYICYDGDSAGQAATMRGLDILKSHGLKVKVISLPNGEDPDEVIKRLGVQGFLDCKDKAVELTEYKLLKLKSNNDFSTPDGRATYAKQAVEVIKQLDTEVEKAVYCDYVSKASGIAADIIKKQVQSTVPSDEITAPITEASSAEVDAARYVMRQFLYGLKEWQDVREYMPTEHLAAVADYLAECHMQGKAADMGLLYHIIPESEAGAIIDYDVSKYEGAESRAFDDCLERLKAAKNTREIKKLENLYLGSSDDAERAELMKRIAGLRAKK